MNKIFIALLSVSACSQLNEKAGLKDDNKLEEFIEEQIHEKTGVEIDLTPESKDQS